MFKNSGSKIKGLSIALFVLMVLVFVIYGIKIMDYDGGTGFIIIVVGLFLAWVYTLFIYGFGELIQNTNEMNDTAKRIEQQERLLRSVMNDISVMRHHFCDVKKTEENHTEKE